MGCSKAETGDKTTASDSFEVSSQKTSPVKITLNEVAHSVFYAPHYVAISEGFFEEEGLEIELINAGGADKAMAALISGEVQVGFMGPEATIYVYNEGGKDQPINFAQVTQRDGSFLVSKNPNPDFKLVIYLVLKLSVDVKVAFPK